MRPPWIEAEAEPRTLELDIAWMPAEVRAAFAEAADMFADAIRTGIAQKYEDAERRMRSAGQLRLRLARAAPSPQGVSGRPEERT